MTGLMKPYGALAGRVLLSLIFLLSGFMKIMTWSETSEKMAKEGMVAVPFFLFMAILFELAGGLSVLLGYKTRWGALALVFFLIPVTLVFHDFWTYTGPEAQNQMQHFLKNVTIMGGLVALAVAGAGRFSLDALFSRAGGAAKSPGERDAVLGGLRGMIKDIRVGMLTTATPDGTLRSRPMATQTERDGALWFFTRADAAKACDIQDHPHVNVSYASPEENRYVSVSGTGTLVRDRKKMEELWDVLYKAWFPRGLDDPDIALLKIDVDQAEYWDAPRSTMAEIAGFVKAAATEHPHEVGEHAQVGR